MHRLRRLCGSLQECISNAVCISQDFTVCSPAPGQPEAKERVRAMIAEMDQQGFGSCSNTGACEAQCPKQIKLFNIARLNREYYKAF
jgi:succinate dehydrogenase/fumarate reductase-like Fe-S protein